MLLPENVSQGVIWMNGEFLPWNDASIHPITHGLHYASSVFEGERAYNGKIFKSLEHSKRLHKSASILDMDVPFSADILEKAKYEVLKRCGYNNAYIRMFAYRGGEEMGISAPQTSVNVAIAAWEWPSYFGDKAVTKGLSLTQSKWCKPDPRTAPCESKAAGLYMIGTLSKHAAMRAGFDDTLMMDYRGFVAESSGANLFMVKNGTLITPTPDCFLNGITRQTVIQLANEHGIEVQEKHIELDELMRADEVFVTGTAAEVTPVGQIEQHVFGVGDISLKLRESYKNISGSN